MAFNVKNPETHALAKEVAEMAGESMAKAVHTSLRERRDRLSRKGIAAKLDEIAVAAARELPAGTELSTDWLYDEKGLPK